ncbi:MAG: DEAD/DEAH box helicase [candidate division WOR-3 bacterium]|nr:DEAD/DEAH box helicase [candidate division WOR-3 bacterium]
MKSVKELLIRTYFPFFGHFGRFTEVQIKAIPEIINGKDVLVISPAATGKTEAVVAPMIENALKTKPNKLAILYISPTRALVNDLYRRLVDKLEYLDLKLDRKTGDYPTIKETDLPFMLITTPESFDSMLCRHPKIFTNLYGVILDELHLLDKTPRGDQLRILLNRLERLRKSLGITDKLQYTALSATIDDLTIAERYFAEPNNIRVICVQQPRELDYKLVYGKDNFIHQLLDYFTKNEFRKILWFFNARSLAEGFLQTLKRIPAPYPVWVHHSSLSRKEREQVEQLMNRESRGILCATSTLELGIDIGDIDCVVLYRPPYNVSSLLQRIGRGNRRRENYLFAIGIYTSLLEKIQFEIFFECAKQGLLYERNYIPSISILPQVIFSYAFQRRRIGLTYDAFMNITQNYLSDAPEIKYEVFNHLVETEYISAVKKDIYFLTDKLEKKIEFGKIHSNLQEKSFGSYSVYNAETGTFLGQVFYLSERFILGGKTYELLRLEEKERKVFVKYLKDASGTTKVFEGTGTIGYHYKMIPLFLKRLFSKCVENINGFPYFIENKQVHIIHLLGGLYSFILKNALLKEGFKITDVSGLLFIFPQQKVEPITFPIPKESSIREVISEHLLRLEDNLGSGAFFRFLPKALQIEDHYRTLDMAGLLQFLKSQKLVEIDAESWLSMEKANER